MNIQNHNSKLYLVEVWEAPHSTQFFFIKLLHTPDLMFNFMP